MKTVLKWLLAAAIVASLAVALATWPLVADVETGKTPEYPDLRVKEYAASPDRVAKAAESALGKLPHWEIVGNGHGRAGHRMEAVHTALLVWKDDVSVRIWREGERTRVSVRSKSRMGKADLGQNARNIRELLAALDRELT
jgi:uncharacterized protein (DUF1499 family)